MVQRFMLEALAEDVFVEQLVNRVIGIVFYLLGQVGYWHRVEIYEEGAEPPVFFELF